ncbi:MAG: hypothetical protein K5839_05245 [Treponemataceae bacterium]|nr:hypothetical protein [Treponemataceae bacterium]
MAISEKDRKKIIDDMCEMIKCRTVSNIDDSLVDWDEFEKFRSLLKERFPAIYSVCEFKRIGKSGIMHKIEGENPDNSMDRFSWLITMLFLLKKKTGTSRHLQAT